MHASVHEENPPALAVSIPMSTMDRIAVRFPSVEMFPRGSAAQRIVAEQRRHADDLIRALRQNPELARCVIRFGNSFESDSSGRPRTIGGAVDRWGVRRCANWLTASGLARLYGRWSHREPRILERDWPNALQTAALTSTLVRSLELGCRGEELPAALCLPIGKILREAATSVNRKAMRGRRIPQADPQEKSPGETREFERELRTWFALTNRLPSSITQLVTTDDVLSEPSPANRLAFLIQLSAEWAGCPQQPEEQAAARAGAVGRLQQILPDWNRQQCALLLDSACEQAQALVTDWQKLFRIVQTGD